MLARSFVGAFILLALSAFGQDKTEPIAWSGTDVRGAQVKIPAADGVTIVLFIRVDQEQSEEAVAQVRGLLGQGPAVARVVAVVSGDGAKDAAQRIGANQQWAWPIVVDPEHALSGQLAVHAWPTTVVIAPDGKPAGRVAGMSQAYARSIGAYVDLAAGKVDEATLRSRLENNAVVADSAAQTAERHLKIAQRLLERGMTEQAKIELAAALDHPPEDLGGRMALADALLIVGRPKEAMTILGEPANDAVSTWQAQVLRGRALVALEKWDEAREVLLAAVKRSTAPAEAWYELGNVYQHEKDWQRAAESYRSAFEATSEGKRLNPQGAATGSRD